MEYKPILENDDLDLLYKAILKLKTKDECYRFFEDLCTINEMKSLAQRIEVAKMLHDGTTYHDIVEKTATSTATISRINRCLHYGAGGYAIALDRIKEEDE